MEKLKKTGFSVAIIALALSAGFEANAQKATGQSQLPATAQTFITDNFAGQTIKSFTVDKDLRTTEYDVVISNGATFEFDKDGNWEEIDGNTSTIPASVLPKAIADYINQNHSGMSIVEVEKDKKKYEVEFSDGTDLEFDLNGKLMKIDK
jgi:hypothetical protein